MLTEQQRQTGQKLLDEQLWVLGRDVVSPQGNLLQKRGAVKSTGFLKTDEPAGHLKTQYEFWNALGQDGDLFLWGFGIWMGTPQNGLWLSRSNFIPKRTVGDIELFEKDAEPLTFGPSTDMQLLLAGVDWFIQHEWWVELNASDEHQKYRRATFPRATHQFDLADAWANFIYSIIEQRAA